MDFGYIFAVLEPMSDHPEGRGFSLRDCFVAGGRVCENAREVWNFAEPAAIGFAFNVDREITHAS